MKTAYLHCTLLDGTLTMEPRPDTTVLVEDGKITAIETGAPAPAGYEVIDLAGKTLMPGLINLHVHLPGSGIPPKKPRNNNSAAKLVLGTAIGRRIGLAMEEKYAKIELMSGVTTVRAVGGLGNIDAAVRRRIEEGKAVGPRLLTCNTAVTVPGGHMVGSVAAAGESPEACRALVRNAIAGGADWVKLMITGGVLDATVKGEPGVVRMPLEYVAACCDEAHKAGYKVAAHVESTEGVRVALKGGVDTIEHGAAMDDEIIALYKETGAADICTISPAIPLAKFDAAVSGSTEMTQFNGEIVFEGITNGAKQALENGIPVGLGTDSACPFVTHYDMWREVQYFHKYTGVSKAFALHTATLANARIAGVGDITGSVEVGKCADFLVTAANPLDDLTVLRAPEMVVARGLVYNKPHVDKDAAIEAELDKFM